MTSLNDIDYELPSERIAQNPADTRDHSRLLVLDRNTGEITHHQFFELVDLLQQGDVLVRNRSRVIPARLHAKKPTGGAVEVLLLSCKNQAENIWECLCKPGLRPEQILEFPNNVSGVVIEHVRDSFSHLIKFSRNYEQFLSNLESIGETPLPPYIDDTKLNAFELVNRYQTTYAAEAGSVAAPTAGLHFTKALDEQLIARGITIEEVVLHVGLGTFAPIREDDVTHHEMHEEWFSLDRQTAERLNKAKREGRRIIAVGTTTVRVLESCAEKQVGGTSLLITQTGNTKIYIYPPYQFKFVDALITNFHLPKSSLLLLVSAFVSAPNTKQTFTNFQESLVGAAYKEAIEKEYRFFSFGDAMFVQ